jgi:hypothetical protein
MAGVKGKSGGSRPGAGRRPLEASEELRELFNEACPRDDRVGIINSIVARAKAADPRCAAFVFDRLYGTPKSGDDLLIQEKVDAEVDSIIRKIREVCPQDTADQIIESIFSSG